ncbi:MAG: right-handed parallel beta-helix repeat-containing protein [Acidobacteriota bacterium]
MASQLNPARLFILEDYMKYVRHAVLTVLVVCAFAARLAAQSVVFVDDDHAQCGDALYTSIQPALNAVTTGGTVVVCPGVYPEQLRITRNVTVVGYPIGNASAAIIRPTSAVPIVSFTGRSITPVVIVKPVTGSLGSVTLVNLTIDGGGLAFAGCEPAAMGVYYGNSSGQMYALAVRNITNGPTQTGCQGGLGIYVQSGLAGTSTVTISNSTVHDYDKNGITANEVGTNVTIRSNTITGLGDKTQAAQNGIQIGYGAKATIESTGVTNHAWGGCTAEDCAYTASNILIYGASNSSVRSNLLSRSQVNVAVQSAPAFLANNNLITANLISDDLFDGVSVFDANSNQVTNNLINNSGEAGVFVDGTGNANTVSGNTIDEGTCGVLAPTNPVAANTYYNTVTNVCLAAPTALKASASNGGDQAKQVQPVR